MAHNNQYYRKFRYKSFILLDAKYEGTFAAQLKAGLPFELACFILSFLSTWIIFIVILSKKRS